VSLYAADETSHRSRQFWTSSINWKVTRSSLSPSAILWSITQITWTERVFWLVDSRQHTFANCSHVKYEFTNAKKLVKKLARTEASSICRRQQFANVFADCICAVHTHQLEFANTSLPILVWLIDFLCWSGWWALSSSQFACVVQCLGSPTCVSPCPLLVLSVHVQKRTHVVCFFL